MGSKVFVGINKSSTLHGYYVSFSLQKEEGSLTKMIKDKDDTVIISKMTEEELKTLRSNFEIAFQKLIKNQRVCTT